MTDQTNEDKLRAALYQVDAAIAQNEVFWPTKEFRALIREVLALPGGEPVAWEVFYTPDSPQRACLAVSKESAAVHVQSGHTVKPLYRAAILPSGERAAIRNAALEEAEAICEAYRENSEKQADVPGIPNSYVESFHNDAETAKELRDAIRALITHQEPDAR